jgi:SAM-dependent methyltransferase
MRDPSSPVDPSATHVFYFQATHPLIDSAGIRAFLRAFCESDPAQHDSLVSVTPRVGLFYREETGLERAQSRSDRGPPPVNFDPADVQNTQDTPRLMEVAYAMAILPVDHMEKHRNLLGLRPLHYALSELEAIDIDTRFDWDVAQFFYRRRARERREEANGANRHAGEPIDPKLSKEATSAQRLSHALQRVLRFSDAEIALFADALERDVAPRLSEPAVEPPACADAYGCVKEAFARLLVALDWTGHLPVGQSPWRRDGGMGQTHPRCGRPGQCQVEGLFRVARALHPDTSPLIGEPDGGSSAHALAMERHQQGHFMVRSRDALLGARKRVVGGARPGRCLEWDNDNFTRGIFSALCSERDVIRFADRESDGGGRGAWRSEPRRDPPGSGTMFFTDVCEEDTLDRGGILPTGVYDLIVAEQVFEHLPRPRRAMAALFRAARPGGYIVWGAPHVSIHHPDPGDYWRFTVQGAELLAKEAGFEVVRTYAPGDAGRVAGIVLGVHADYWAPEQVIAEAPGEYLANWGLWNVQTHMLLRRPKA